jgi:hypothetical protein
VQRQLPGKVIGTVAYAGSTGRHIVARYDANTPIATLRSDGTLFTPSNATRRQPQFSELQTRRLSGLSYYNSLQLSFVRRSSNGLQLQGSYTFSKSIDMSGGLFSEEASNAAVGVAMPDNLFNERGLSNFDIRHSAVFRGKCDRRRVLKHLKPVRIPAHEVSVAVGKHGVVEGYGV